MNSNYKIIFAFFLGVILRTLTNPWILGYGNENFSFHKNKIYDAILFGSVTGVIQIIIDSYSLTLEHKLLWLFLFISIFFIINHLIVVQTFVSDTDLLLKLKENYAESLEFSKILLREDKLTPNIRKFIIDHIGLKYDAIDQINILLKQIK